jgi:hypothetical protein
MSLPNPSDSSSGLSLLGNELVVDLARALSGRTRAQKIPIAPERGPTRPRDIGLVYRTKSSAMARSPIAFPSKKAGR